MKLWLVLLAAASLLPGISSATCVYEPLEPQLKTADVVYVGTVVQSRLTSQIQELRTDPPHGRPTAQHELLPQIVLKGTPQAIPSVLSGTGYADPRSGRFWEIAELVKVTPGDTLLVVGNAGEPAYVSLCSASRPWDSETSKVVRAAFPSAP